MSANVRSNCVREELQKVVGERGRRGSLMRGLQRIDRVEIDSPARSKADDSEE